MTDKKATAKAPVKKSPAKKVTKAVEPKKDEVETRGRKTLLTPEVFKEIIDSVSVGVPYKDAIKAQGIDASTFYRWLKRGSDEAERLERNPDAKPDPEESLFCDFFQSIERGKSVAVNIHVKNVSRAAVQGDWRASAWWLERRRPEEFGKDAVIAIANQTNNTQINLGVTMAELNQLVDEVMAIRGDDDRETD